MPHSPISPSFQTSFRLLRMIAQQIDESLVDPAGLQVLRKSSMWRASERSTVRNVFDSLLFQSLDELGLPRFTLPVEYVAAAIVAFVHPINYFTACMWSESHGSTTDEMTLAGEYDTFTARQLFAVVCNVYAQSDGVGPGTFDSRVDVAIRDAIEPLREAPLEEEIR